MKHGLLVRKIKIDLSMPVKPKVVKKTGERKRRKNIAGSAHLIPLQAQLSPLEVMEVVFSCCTNVRELAFVDPEGNHTQLVLALLTSTTIPPHFTSVRELSISHLPAQMAFPVIAKCPKLEMLTCYGTIKEQANPVLALPVSITIPPQFTSLCQLSINRISALTAIPIIARCPMLETLLCSNMAGNNNCNLLGTHIAALRHLSRIEFHEVHAINNLWTPLDWPKTLTTLYIDASWELIPYDTPALFNNMAQNVTHLRFIIEDDDPQEQYWNDKEQMTKNV